MKQQMKIILWVLTLALAMPLAAADKKAPAMDPQMMEAMKLGMPGPNHQVLTPTIGTWTATTKGWMKPGDKPQESKGTLTSAWVFGGRFVKQEYKGDWGGQPFEGLGYYGYDNVLAEYQSIWMDSMSSSIMITKGQYDPATKTITTSGTISCPMGKEKEKWMRTEWKIIDNDNNTYTSYFKDDTGKEFKSMEITYKRVK